MSIRYQWYVQTKGNFGLVGPFGEGFTVFFTASDPTGVLAVVEKGADTPHIFETTPQVFNLNALGDGGSAVELLWDTLGIPDSPGSVS